MTGSLTISKTVAAGVSLVFAMIVALVTTIAQGFLWEGPNAHANQKTADSNWQASIAANTQAQNTLLAAIEAAKGVTEGSRLQADSNRIASENLSRATIVASERNAEGAYNAAHEVAKAENSGYDQITKHFVGDPVEKADALNTQIIRLRNEIESGRDSGTGWQLSDEERAKRQAKKEALELEHKIQSEITTKNWQDAMGMVMGVLPGLGDIGSLYGQPADRIPPDRRLPRHKELEK